MERQNGYHIPHDQVVRELMQARAESTRAVSVAEAALKDISAHEKICSERYETIKEKLTNIPKIYDKIGGLEKLANRLIGALLLSSTGFFGVMIAIIIYISKQHP